MVSRGRGTGRGGGEHRSQGPHFFSLAAASYVHTHIMHMMTTKDNILHCQKNKLLHYI